MLLRRGRQALPLLPGTAALCPRLGSRILLVLIFHSVLYFWSLQVFVSAGAQELQVEEVPSLLAGRAAGEGCGGDLGTAGQEQRG